MTELVAAPTHGCTLVLAETDGTFEHTISVPSEHWDTDLELRFPALGLTVSATVDPDDADLAFAWLTTAQADAVVAGPVACELWAAGELLVAFVAVLSRP